MPAPKSVRLLFSLIILLFSRTLSSALLQIRIRGKGRLNAIPCRNIILLVGVVRYVSCGKHSLTRSGSMLRINNNLPVFVDIGKPFYHFRVRDGANLNKYSVNRKNLFLICRAVGISDGCYELFPNNFFCFGIQYYFGF